MCMEGKRIGAVINRMNQKSQNYSLGFSQFQLKTHRSGWAVGLEYKKKKKMSGNELMAL